MIARSVVDVAREMESPIRKNLILNLHIDTQEKASGRIPSWALSVLIFFFPFSSCLAARHVAGWSFWVIHIF